MLNILACKTEPKTINLFKYLAFSLDTSQKEKTEVENFLKTVFTEHFCLSFLFHFFSSVYRHDLCGWSISIIFSLLHITACYNCFNIIF